VHVAVGLTPAQIKAYRIADNQTASLSRWNEELLPLELSQAPVVPNFPVRDALDRSRCDEAVARQVAKKWKGGSPGESSDRFTGISS
jgi:hypothetical protein